MRSRSSGSSTGVRVGRWSAAVVILVIAALLGGLAVVAGYLRTEVLNTDAYVETVAPLAADPVVQSALAQRLTTEIIDRSNIAAIANDVATKLVAIGAPGSLTTLVGPLVGALTSFLNDKIRTLLSTPQFETIWEAINRTAHTAIVTILTGTNGRFLHNSGTSVTIDLGQLLTALKAKLVAAGLTFVDKVPTVSIPYTLIQSDKLPTIRRYARILDIAGVWLPFVALAIFIGGVMTAPNRRRAILTGVIMLGVVTILLLVAIKVGRHIYLDRLPDTVQSPAAALALFDAITKFLISALQALLVAVLIALVVVVLAGPSRLAVWLRRLVGRGFDAAARELARGMAWTRRFGPRLVPLRRPLEIGLVLVGVIVFILIDRPSATGVLLLALCLLIVFVVIEILARVRPPHVEPA